MKKVIAGSVFASLLFCAGVAFAETSTTTPTTTTTTSSPSTQCPQGWTWNGSNCQINQQSCTAAGGTWDNTSALCSFSTNTTTSPSNTSQSSGFSGPSNQCPSGQYWYNGSCITPQQGCAQYGGTWNGNNCQMPNQATYQQPTTPPISSGTNASSTYPLPPQYYGSSTTYQYQGFGGQGNQQGGQWQQYKGQAERQQLQMMTRQSQRMAKEFASAVKKLQRLQKRLSARGLPLPQTCNDVIDQAQGLIVQMKNAGSASTTSMADISTMIQSVQNTQDTLQACQSEGQQMLYVPTLMKTMGRTFAVLKKNGVDVSAIMSEYNTYLAPGYESIKAGTASDDDIQTFFDTADDIRGQMEDAMTQANIPIPDLFQQFSNGGHSVGGSAGLGTSTPKIGTTSPQSLNSSSLTASAFEALVQLLKQLHR